jgi:hypothetical protein
MIKKGRGNISDKGDNPKGRGEDKGYYAFFGFWNAKEVHWG